MSVKQARAKSGGQKRAEHSSDDDVEPNKKTCLNEDM